MLLICFALRSKAAYRPGLGTGSKKEKKGIEVSVAAWEKAPRVWNEAVSEPSCVPPDAQIVVSTLIVFLLFSH